MWVLLFAHLAYWATIKGQTHTGLSVARWLGAVFQSGGETHPAVLGFIVLSGYCIHRRGFRAGSISRAGLRAFAIRRATRILPVFFLAVAAGVVLWEIGIRHDAETTGALSSTRDLNPLAVAGKALTVDAWVPGWNFDLWQGNAPLHTVAAEIWLYIFYPFIALALTRVRERWFWASIVGLELVAALVLTGRLEWTNWWHNVSGVGFLLYWWIGAKMVGVRPGRRLAAAAAGAGLAWFALTAIIKLQSDAFLVVEGRKAAFAVLVGCLIVVADRPLRVPAVASRLGEAGYSLYAFHAPIAYLGIALNVWWPLVAAAAVGAGLMMFHAVERPAMMWGRVLAGRKTPVAEPATRAL